MATHKKLNAHHEMFAVDKHLTVCMKFLWLACPVKTRGEKVSVETSFQVGMDL